MKCLKAISLDAGLEAAARVIEEVRALLPLLDLLFGPELQVRLRPGLRRVPFALCGQGTS